MDNLFDIRQQVNSSSEVVGLLSTRLTDGREKQLITCEFGLAKLIDLYAADHPFLLASKAERLSYLHQNLYQDGDIITDVRPIFDTAGARVVEMIVTHSSSSVPIEGASHQSVRILLWTPRTF